MRNDAGGHAVEPHHRETSPPIALVSEASRSPRRVRPEGSRLHMSLFGEPPRPARSRVRREKSRSHRDRVTRNFGGGRNAGGGHPPHGLARGGGQPRMQRTPR